MTHIMFLLERADLSLSHVFLSLKSSSVSISLLSEIQKFSHSRTKQAIRLPLDLRLSNLGQAQLRMKLSPTEEDGVWGTVYHLILRVAIRVLS